MSFIVRLLRAIGLIANPSKDDSIQQAQQVLNAFRDHDTPRLRSFLPLPLRFFLSASRRDALWRKLEALTGKPKFFTQPEVHEDGFLRTLKALYTFETLRMGVTVTFLGNSLVGVNLQPPINLGLVPSWTAPSYVDETSFIDNEITLRGAWGAKVRGTLTVPKFKGRKPAVLFLAGSGPMDRDCSLGGSKVFKDAAHGLASSGVVALRMDKPNIALLLKTVLTKSITEYDEYIPTGLAALKYLSTHPDVDPAQIFILGASLGGGVAPRLCAASPLPVAGIISMAGKSKPLIDAVLAQMAYSQEHFPKPKVEYEKKRALVTDLQTVLQSGKAPAKGENPADKLPIPIPLSYWKDDYNTDSVEIAKTLDLPMLIMQGKDDWQVTLDHFDKGQKGLQSPSSKAKPTFRLYDGLGHLFVRFKNKEKGMLQYDEPGHLDEEVMRDIVQWIQQVVQH